MNLVKKIALTLGAVSLAGSAFAEVKQPLAIVNRPITQPAGQGVAGLGFAFTFIKDQDALKNLGIGFGYGINDKLEVGLSYNTFLEDGIDFKGPLALHLAYNLTSAGSQLNLAPNASIGYDTFGEVVTPLTLGARVRYNLDDKMAIYSPGNQLSISVDGAFGGGGPNSFTYPVVNSPMSTLGGAFGYSDVNPIFLTLPVGFGYQATPNLAIGVETTLANVEIADSETTVIFADMIPVGLRGVYAVNSSIDVGLTFDIDLDNTDTSALGLFARAFF